MKTASEMHLTGQSPDRCQTCWHTAAVFDSARPGWRGGDAQVNSLLNMPDRHQPWTLALQGMQGESLASYQSRGLHAYLIALGESNMGGASRCLYFFLIFSTPRTNRSSPLRLNVGALNTGVPYIPSQKRKVSGASSDMCKYAA